MGNIRNKIHVDLKILCNINENLNFLSGGNSQEVGFEELQKEENLKKIYRIQFSKAPKIGQLEKVLQAIEKKPSIKLRFYGNYAEEQIDWKILRNIQNLQIDLWHSSKLEHISELSNLKILGISKNLSSKVSLEILNGLKQLETLYTSISKGIETVGKLDNLKFLSLRQIKKEDLGFLRNLNKLRELWISLGSYNSFEDLTELPSLQKLSIHQARGFDAETANLVLPRCKKLEALQLQNLKHLTNLEFMPKVQNLNFVQLEGIKNLETYEPIEKAVKLLTFIGYECRPADKSLTPLIDIENLWVGDSYPKSEKSKFLSKTKAKNLWIRGKKLKGDKKPENPFEINLG